MPPGASGSDLPLTYTRAARDETHQNGLPTPQITASRPLRMLWSPPISPPEDYTFKGLLTHPCIHPEGPRSAAHHVRAARDETHRNGLPPPQNSGSRPLRVV